MKNLIKSKKFKITFMVSIILAILGIGFTVYAYTSTPLNANKDISTAPYSYCVNSDGSKISNSYSNSGYLCIDSSHNNKACVMTYNGEYVYCMGNYDEHTPDGTVTGQLYDDVALTNSDYSKMFAAAFAGASGNTNVNGVTGTDLYYVTQCAIRALHYGISANSLSFYTASGTYNADMTAAFRTIMSAANTSLKNQTGKVSISGSANQTLVNINGVSYWRSGPYTPTFTDCTPANYSVVLSNNSAFHSSSATPTSTSNSRGYTAGSSFYVYSPANSKGSTTINVNASVTLNQYNPTVYLVESGYQNVIGIKDVTSQVDIKEGTEVAWDTAVGSLRLNKQMATNDGIILDQDEVSYSLMKDCQFVLKDSTGAYLTATYNSSTSTYTCTGTTASINSATKFAVSVLSGRNMYTTINNVPIGTYTVAEKKGMDGYTLAADKNVTIENNAQSAVTFVNRQGVGNIWLQKTAENDGKIEGIVFTLTGITNISSEYTDTATTDERGYAFFTNIPYGKYTITEDGATTPAGYVTANEQGVIVKTDESILVEVYNEIARGNLELNKTTDDGNGIEGIVFTLTGTADCGESVNLTATTDANGYASFTDVPVGTYTLHEDGSSVDTENYMVAADKTVTITYGETTKVGVHNDTVTIETETTTTTETTTETETTTITETTTTTETTTETTTTGTTPNTPNVPSTPKTGDTFPVVMISFIALAAVGIAVGVKNKRK